MINSPNLKSNDPGSIMLLGIETIEPGRQGKSGSLRRQIHLLMPLGV